MTLFTTNYAWPFPELTDVTNEPAQVENLAVAIDGTVKGVADSVASATTLAALTSILYGSAQTVYYAPSVSVTPLTQGAGGSFAGFRDTGANLLGVSFVAPPSGKVSMSFGAALISSVTTAEVQLTFNIQTGSTVGSGSSQFVGTVNSSIVTKTTTETTPSRHVEISGLTSNASYNASFTWKLSAAGTASAAIPWMEITPLVV